MITVFNFNKNGTVTPVRIAVMKTLKEQLKYNKVLRKLKIRK